MKSPTRVPIALLACVLLMGAAASAAPPATQPDASLPPSEMIRLDLPENLEVKILVEYVARSLGLNIIYDESIGRQRVTVSAHARIPKDSLAGLLDTVLKSAGLVMVDADQPGWKKIVPDKSLLNITRRVEHDTEALGAARPTDVLTQAFEVRHMELGFAQQTVKPFVSTPGGNSFTVTVAERRLLIVTDYADRLRRVAELLDLMDRPARSAQITFLAARHVDPTALAARINELLAEKARVGAGAEKTAAALTVMPEARTGRIVLVSTDPELTRQAMDLAAELDVASDDQTQIYRVQYVSAQRIDKLVRDFLGPEADRSRYRASVDTESGLLIVTAAPAVHERVRSLIEDLDVGAATAASPLRFYKLMNTTAEEVLATIRALDSGETGLSGISIGPGTGAPAEGFTGPNAPPGEPGTRELPRPPAYTPSDAKRDMPTAAAVAPGRLVTARTRDATLAVDPNTNSLIVVAPPEVQRIYEHLIRTLDKRRPQVMIEITMVTVDTSNSFSLGVEVSRGEQANSTYLAFSSFGLSEVEAATGALALTPGVGFNATLLDPDTVDIVLKALATNGRAKVISAPKILVNDHATGSLASVNEAPFTSVNASDTVSTTSFAGFASAGTTIAVTPHISEGDHLQLYYTVNLSSFSGEGSNGIPPPRQTNTVNSEVTIPDGYTVIVGGLSRTDTSETVSKVPFLGDLPLIKHLFRSISENESESTLYVFIRPVILRDDRFEDLKYFSRRDAEQAELPPDMPASDPLLMQ